MLDSRHPLYQLALTQLSLPRGWKHEDERPRLTLRVPPSGQPGAEPEPPDARDGESVAHE